MSGSTLYTYVNSTGVVVPDTTDLLTEVQSEYTAALGSVLNLDSSTPQGALIASETIARKSVLANNALLANQINPNQAGGIFLDAIAALTGLERDAETFSIYSSVTLSGVPETYIPQNTQGETANGDLFYTVSGVFLSSSGSATVSMSAVVAGPVAAPSGTLTLVSGVLGLETIVASAAGTLGQYGQSDVSFRALRRQTLALQGISLSEAITSAMNALPGVNGVQFYDNYTDAPVTIDGVTVAAKSTYLCVDGGTAAQIAETYVQNKTGGGGWSGGTSTPYTDPYSGQIYEVAYDVPTLVPFLIRVTVKQGSFTGTLINAVSNAVVAFANNTVAQNTPTDLGIVGFVVGGNVSPFEIAGAIQAQCPGVYIQKVEVTTVAANTYVTTEVDLNLNQKATVTAGNIDVVVNT
jgi:uncharacterized phage protein gp47/JayE